MSIQVGMIAAKVDSSLGGISESLGVDLEVLPVHATLREKIAALALVSCMTVAMMGSSVLSFDSVSTLIDKLTPGDTVHRPVHNAACAEISKTVLHDHFGWDAFAMDYIDNQSTARGFSRNISRSIADTRTAFVCRVESGDLIARSPRALQRSTDTHTATLDEVLGS